MDDLHSREAGALQLTTQAPWCHALGSPLYGALLERAALDCGEGGVVWSILEGQENEPLSAAVALRFMGAVHGLVLAGEAPELARHYPSCGGTVGNLEQAWQAFRQTLLDNEERLRRLARLPVQTNEVGRSAVLLGGFLTIAERTSLPLRLLEIGASAGLNLRWDRFRYETADAAWGDARSPVRFERVFEDVHPSLATRVEVVARVGCDVQPLDPGSEDGQATLRAYLWPDQTARRRRLDGAIEVAAALPVTVERIGAGDFLARELAGRVPKMATVIFHSIMIQYVPKEERRRVFETIRAAGERADADAPLAWLRFEPAKGDGGDWIHRLDLTLWPGGEEMMLATASPHGPPVKWMASPLGPLSAAERGDQNPPSRPREGGQGG